MPPTVMNVECFVNGMFFAEVNAVDWLVFLLLFAGFAKELFCQRMIEDVGLLRVHIETHQQFIEAKQGEAVCQSKMGILNFDCTPHRSFLQTKQA